MIKRVLKGVGIVFLALIVIGLILGKEPTVQSSASPSQMLETEQFEQAEPLDPDISEPNFTENQEAPTISEDANAEQSSTPTAVPASSSVSGNLKVHFIDVGQGDSILIQAPSGKTMLIDAGNNTDGQKIVNYIKNQGISKLDVVIGTHPHADHIGGLDTVIDSLDIGQVVMPNKTHTTQTYRDVLTAIKNKGLKITSAKPGVTLDLGGGITVSVLAPVKTNYNELNDYSTVIRLAFGNTSFLFTGDAESASESDMISSGDLLSATVLKVGHHGSSTSTSQVFLNKINPKYAVIMVGKDSSYGHPDQGVLNRLTNIGAKIYRTDLNGTIIASSDGSNVTFNTSPTEVKASGSVPSAKPTPAPSPTPTKPGNPPPVSAGDENVIVYKTNTGTKYHLSGCTSLSKSKIEITLKKAKEQGLEPCKRCNPPK